MTAPKVKPNPGVVYAAMLELTTALRAMEELGIPLPLGIASPGHDEARPSAALEAAQAAEDEALGVCFEAIRVLTDEIWGEWPLHTETARWNRVTEILKLKGWPDPDFIVEQARESAPAKEGA